MQTNRLIAALLVSLLLPVALLQPAGAANTAQREKGLLISPLRNYVKVDAGKQQSGVFTVANLTSKAIVANLSVKEFSVADYTYSYQFRDAKNSWISLDKTQVSLQPNNSQKIRYTISPPAGSAPGGQYYTLFASADLSNSEINGTVQAATLLYITVNGKLIQSGHIESSSIKRLVFGREIPYDITLRNTGNVHYFVFISGQLNGLFANSQNQSVTHLLMPDTVRRMRGSIKSPVLPGIYKASYGYKTNSGTSGTQSRYIVFIPPWSIAALLIVAICTRYFIRKKRSVSRTNHSVDN